jgi:hypothetical protein
VTIQDSQLGANYDLADAWRLDHILNAAKDNGIYIQLNLEDVNSFAYNWYNEGEYGEKNLYASEAGGPCQDRWDYFTRQDTKDYAKRVYRYMVARYGYSTNLASWELWNEIDCIQYWTDLANFSELLAWHQEFGQWFKENDPNEHLVTTSYGSFTPDASMWRLDEIGYAQMHGYYVPGWTAHPSDPLGRNMADFINYYTKMALSRMADNSINKPVVFGEFGIVNDSWIISQWQDGVAPDDFEGIHLHNGFWSGLMSGLASTPLAFWSHYCLEEGYPAYFEHGRAIANFVAGEALSSADYVPVSEGSISVSNAGLGVLGLKNATGGLFWIQNKEHTWYKVVAEGATPQTVSGATMTVTGLATGDYLVEWWDTYRGTVMGEERVLVDESTTLTVSIPDLQTDIACKVRSYVDTDGDGLPNDWETAKGLDPNDATGDNGADGDPDGDGLANAGEYSRRTDPLDPDTDYDGLPDGWEVTYGLEPLDPDDASADADGDGYTNLEEYQAGSDPRDESDAANRPPYEPSTPFPSDGQNNVPAETSLMWSSGDPDGDELTFDIYFGDTYPPRLLEAGWSPVGDPVQYTYDLPTLAPGTRYYWRIVAFDGRHEALGPGPTEDETWSFEAGSSPTARFTVQPSVVRVDTRFLVDASTSSDYEDAVEALVVRWDWESDGIYDTPFVPDKIASHRYSEAGSYAVTLQVRDSADLSSECTHEVQVKTLAQIVLDVAVGLYEYDGCDLNGDGEVNAADAIICLKEGL